MMILVSMADNHGGIANGIICTFVLYLKDLYKIFPSGINFLLMYLQDQKMISCEYLGKKMIGKS